MEQLETATVRIKGERAGLELEGGVLRVYNKAAKSDQRVTVDRVLGATYSTKKFPRPWLHVQVSGGTPTPSRGLAAMTDPYTVPLNRAVTEAELKNFVALISDYRARNPVAAEQAGTSIGRIGPRLSGKAAKSIEAHAQPGEEPWLLIHDSGSGVLAAFDDRLLIVKVGAWTSLMTGSFGGGRVSLFPYTEITGIEYNSGLLLGVLEILTPSYDGSANKDFWRGTDASRNADSNDPFTLSNTLPLPKHLYQQALPHINELRRRIGEAKRPHVVVTMPPATAVVAGFADELAQLGALHSQGLLDTDEFRDAKQALIARQGQPDR